MNRIEKCRPILWGLAMFAAAAQFGPHAARSAPVGQLVIIEPDDFADDQLLDNVSPHVTISTGAFSDFRPTFSVYATDDPDGASTGIRVFSHSGIPFWNDGRALRMDFHSLVTDIQLDYIASGFFDDLYTCRLEAYSSAGVLLDSYTTAPLAEAQVETMSVSAPQISYALAYPTEDPFGDLDALSFTVVPEPGTLLLGGTFLSMLVASPAGRLRRRRDRFAS
jgi:hypothetical protein